MTTFKKIKFSIQSCLDDVQLISISTSAIANYLFDAKTAKSIELSVVEALNNIIKHSYESKSDQLIDVVLTIDDHCLKLEFIDYGIQMAYSLKRRDPPKVDPNDISSLPECGYGLYLMQNLMDDISYHTEGNANTLTMIKYLKNNYKKDSIKNPCNDFI